MQRPEKSDANGLAPHGLLDLISYIFRTTSPGVDPHSMDCFLSNQSLIENMPFRLAHRLIL